MWRAFLKCQKTEKLRNAVFMQSLCVMALMFISGEVELGQVTHDAQKREG